MTDRAFPHAALTPAEAYPRITPEHADEVIKLLEANDRFETSPAIVIAVWDGPLVKYLITDDEVSETIRRLKQAAEAAGGEPADG